VILNLLAAATTFVALSVVSIWFIWRPGSDAEQRLRTLSEASRERRKLEKSSAERARLDVEPHGADFFVLIPSGLRRRTDQRLALAGRPLTPSAFYALVLALATLVPFLLGAVLLLAEGGISGRLIFLAPVFALIGAWIPFAWLRSRVRGRQAAIRRELPDVLDLLTLCVEAGLGLDAAFRRVSEEMPGALTSELRQMLDEVDLGKPRRQALLDLAERVPLPELSVVVNAMIQSQEMGTSLASTLRAQTHRLRVKRRQRAEQVARHASVKMAFPLVLFFMPSIFLVILGPIAISLADALKN
jgi:tight adherence protein C